MAIELKNCRLTIAGNRLVFAIPASIVKHRLLSRKAIYTIVITEQEGLIEDEE